MFKNVVNKSTNSNFTAVATICKQKNNKERGFQFVCLLFLLLNFLVETSYKYNNF